MVLDDLEIEVTEELCEFDHALLVQWRDPDFWASGAWRRVVPKAEWAREQTFRNQGAGGLEGYHFVEVLQMQALAAAGLSWQYENFDFFRPVGPGSKVHVKGYKVVAAAYGSERIHQLQDLARQWEDVLALFPRTPDLFAYRREPNRIHPVKFVEVKRDDSLSRPQLLGLALIQSALGTPTKVVRYVKEGSGKKPKTYRAVFSSR